MAENKHVYQFIDFSNTAPYLTPKQQPQPIPQPVEKPKVLPQPRLSPQQLAELAQRRNRRVAKIMLTAVLLLSMSCSLMALRVNITALSHEENLLQRQLDELKSEHVRLEMSMTSRMSLDRVEQYAREVLGMIKHNDPVYPIQSGAKDSLNGKTQTVKP